MEILYDKNRRQKRFPMSSEAKVTKLFGGETIKATLTDISSCGACLKTKDSLHPKDILRISIALHPQIQFMRSEDILASVKWIKGGMKDYSIGISFNAKINKKGFPIFSRYLEHLETGK